MRKSIYSERHERFCALLKAARKEAGLTQKQVAKRLRAYPSYVSRYERGDRRLDVVEFLAVAEALGLEPAKVLAKVRG
jgi:transcriptional regulator with XRE-family HTH domain